MFSSTTATNGGNFIDAVRIVCPYSSGGVYIVDDNTDSIDLDIIFTSNTESFTNGSESRFRYTIHKFNEDTNSFNNTPIIESDIIEWSDISGTSATTETLLIDDLDIDGEYIIKGNFINKFCTKFSNKLNQTYDTYNYQIVGDYGLYQEGRDFYFIVFKEADIPILDNEIPLDDLLQTLRVTSFILDDNQNLVLVPLASSEYIVSLNGDIITEDIDYDISEIITGDVTTYLVNLFNPVFSGDVLTVVYINSPSNYSLQYQSIDIQSTIVSGSTNNQDSNVVYFNTDTNKYEVYLDSDPLSGNDIIVSINGVLLANKIDHYKSITNDRRIILEGNLIVGDIINIYYNSTNVFVGNIMTPTPIFSWVIETSPNNNNGLFTVEISDTDDFINILFQGSIPYEQGVTAYSLPITLSGSLGDELYYRIKNEKKYTTLCGNDIYNINYSEVVRIIIGVNSINSY
jgi:hypothetical protein